MAKIIGLPKLSPTMDEGTLVRWAKSEGDTVDVDDLLAEVETDKATMEFRSFDKGVLLKILAAEGETLVPDAPVAIIGKSGEDVSELAEKAGRQDSVAPSNGGERQPKKEEAAPEKAAGASAKPSDEAATEPPEAAHEAEASEGGTRKAASPLVRRMARERGIDLRQVQGSGPRGRIIKRDLETYLERDGAHGVPGPGAGQSVRREPRIEKASSMRRTIARRLTQSKQEIPHYYLSVDVDAEGLVSARAQLNALLEAEGEKVSPNDLIIKTAAVALRRVPQVNASWIDGNLYYHQRVDISVAVAIADGLVTPVVRDADRKGVLEIAREVRELAARAREKRLQPEEMSDGTFSVSNLGMFGVDAFSAVINPPEGAILAVGAVREEPVIREGQVVAGKRMAVTLSCDHRVIDGATGAQWLKQFRALIEDPVRMLL